MRVEELTAEFKIAGVLDFLETEHGLVKAAISLGGMAGEMYLQGAHVTAWQPAGERPVQISLMQVRCGRPGRGLSRRPDPR